MKKYILFDHDGVLVDTEHWYFMANKRALGELGFEIEEQEYLAYMADGKSYWDLAEVSKLGDQTLAQKRLDRNRYYQQHLKTEDIEIPGVEDVLEELSQTYTMAIVTTSKRPDFELIHRKRNILKYMSFVLTVEDYERAKPCPDPYLKGWSKLGVPKEEILVVEDSARGLKSAVAAGLDCAIVHNEFTKSHDFSTATHRIQSLQELPALMEA